MTTYKSKLSNDILERTKKKSLNRAPVIYYVASFLWLLFIAFDFLFAKEFFYHFLPLRIIGISSSLCFALLIPRNKINERISFYFFILFLYVCLTFMFSILHEHSLFYYFTGYAMVIMLVNIIFLFSLTEAVGLFFVTLISYLVFLPISDLPLVVLLGNGGFSTLCVALMMLFVNIALNKLQTNEAKSLVLLEYKNKEIEQKNKDITDSIQYAKKIQDVILPTDMQFQKILPNNFILYKPKDIVSGDFYWITEWGNKKILAVADCTGHGVPGAFMSIMNSNFLSQSVNELGIDKPALILNDIKRNIIKKFQKENSINHLRDGMDVSLIAINKLTNLVEFAGAYNPLWIIRGDKFIEIKADKMSISADPLYAEKHFENHEFQAQEGDILYMFSDGYADQFGGPKGKKFKYSQLKELLLKINHLSMQEQKKALDNQIELWKGNLEQVDDILVIGIKI